MSHFKVESRSTCDSCLITSMVSKWRRSSRELDLASIGGGVLRSNNHVGPSEKLTCFQCSMSGHMVMFQLRVHNPGHVQLGCLD